MPLTSYLTSNSDSIAAIRPYGRALTCSHRVIRRVTSFRRIEHAWMLSTTQSSASTAFYKPLFRLAVLEPSQLSPSLSVADGSMTPFPRPSVRYQAHNTCEMPSAFNGAHSDERRAVWSQALSQASTSVCSLRAEMRSTHKQAVTFDQLKMRLPFRFSLSLPAISRIVRLVRTVHIADSANRLCERSSYVSQEFCIYTLRCDLLYIHLPLTVLAYFGVLLLSISLEAHSPHSDSST